MRIRPALGLITLACVGLVSALPAAAQSTLAVTKGPVAQTTVPTTPATPPAPPAPAADAPAEPRRTPEPNVQRIVSEDDNVRIDEVRVRGQTTQISVHSKTAGGSRYEILPGEAGRDPSLQDKRGAGQRVWRLFSF